MDNQRIVPGDMPTIGIIVGIQTASEMTSFERNFKGLQKNSVILKIKVSEETFPVKVKILKDTLVVDQKVLVFGSYSFWGGVRGLRLQGKIDGWLIAYCPPREDNSAT